MEIIVKLVITSWRIRLLKSQYLKCHSKVWVTLLVLPYHGNRASKSSGPGSLLSTRQPATFYLRTFSETSPSSVVHFLFDVFVVMSCLFFLPTRVLSSGTFSLLHGPYLFIHVLEFTFPELLGCLLSGLHCDSDTIATVAPLELRYDLDFTASIYTCHFLAPPHLLTSFRFW